MIETLVKHKRNAGDKVFIIEGSAIIEVTIEEVLCRISKKETIINYSFKEMYAVKREDQVFGSVVTN